MFELRSAVLSQEHGYFLEDFSFALQRGYLRCSWVPAARLQTRSNCTVVSYLSVEAVWWPTQLLSH